MGNDKKIYNIIKEGQKKYTDLFKEVNELSQDNVYEVNHDAVWVVGKVCKHLKFGDNIEFVMKQSYSSFYVFKIKNVHYKIYYNSDTDKIFTRNFTPNNDDLLEVIRRVLLDLEYNDTNAVYHKLHKKLAHIEDYKEELIKGVSNRIVFQRFIKDLI